MDFLNNLTKLIQFPNDLFAIGTSTLSLLVIFKSTLKILEAFSLQKNHMQFNLQCSCLPDPSLETHALNLFNVWVTCSCNVFLPPPHPH